MSVVLHSNKYFPQWDMTRFTYQLRCQDSLQDPFWVLELDSCFTSELIDETMSSPFEWVDQPFRGARFTGSRTNEKFILFLRGQWDVGEIAVALGHTAPGGEEIVIGSVQGPLCGGAVLSVVIVNGTLVGFPPVQGIGQTLADNGTRLEITSTSAGWTLCHSLEALIPQGASHDVVTRVLRIEYEPYSANVGATFVDVTYLLDVADEDLFGLPEGDYALSITFTVATD